MTATKNRLPWTLGSALLPAPHTEQRVWLGGWQSRKALLRPEAGEDCDVGTDNGTFHNGGSQDSSLTLWGGCSLARHSWGGLVVLCA